jgi:hypothetical protein
VLKIEEIRRQASSKTICGSVLVLLSLIPMNLNVPWVSESPYNQGCLYENYRDMTMDRSGAVCLAAEQSSRKQMGINPSEKVGQIEQEASVCRI